jgi:hypothetical protein
MAVSGVGAVKSEFEKLYMTNVEDPDFPDHEDDYGVVVVDGIAL